MATVVKIGKPKTPPKAITTNLEKSVLDGMSSFLASRYAKATMPASVARPNAMKYGSKLRTAILLTGKVKLKIRMPIKPISIPLVSLFTITLFIYEAIVLTNLWRRF